jgi:hypothetical protein
MKHKYSKEYQRMCHDFKHRLEVAHKTCVDAPFDAESALHYFIEYLYFMKEYYTLGENVWAAEIKGHNRLKKITEALKEWEEYSQFCFNKYYHIEKSKENANVYDVTPLMHEDADVNSELYVKQLEQHWKKFWKIISKEIRYWWD